MRFATSIAAVLVVQAVASVTEAQPPTAVPFAEALRFWLKLGFISFGGPAGQIAWLRSGAAVSDIVLLEAFGQGTRSAETIRQAGLPPYGIGGNLRPMNDAAPGDLTALVDGARAGDDQALARLFEVLYDDLRRVARARLRGGAPITLLDTTALVHESYERFAGLARLDVSSRAHFLAYASRVMRSVIVDAARQRNAQRRGGGAFHVTLTTGLGEALSDDQPDVVRVHEAVEELAQIEPRLARVVEMRHFGGLDYAEIAEALGIGTRTVERDWERARSFLFASLKGDG